MKARAMEDRRILKELTGQLCIEYGPTVAAQQTGCSTGVALYWKEKVLNPNFHNNSWGGKRCQRFPPELEQAIHAVLWAQCQAEPSTTVGEYCSLLTTYGVKVSPSWVKRVFKSWNWSWKKPEKVQLHKFTKENIDYYLDWVANVADLPWKHLKFMDESHCVGKDLSRSHVLGPKGIPTTTVVKDSLTESLSLTLLVDLNKPEDPFGIDLRVASNTQWDFLAFVVEMVAQGHLERNDLLIVDNASVHVAEDIQEPLHVLLDAVGVKLIRLPTYSPELNPCELVFSKMKSYLRWHRNQNLPLWQQLLRGLAEISYEDLLVFYWRCTKVIYDDKNI